MPRRWLCISLFVLVAACSSSHQAATPSSTTLPTGTSSTSTSAPAIPSSGLRGIRVEAFACPPHFVAPAANATPIGTPEALLLCPLGFPGQAGKAVTVVPGRPIFRALITALSRARERSTGAVCPAYADLMQVVLAKTRDGIYQVSVPTDGCGHYQRDALEALNRARAG
jgi:hypothetical protein